MLNTPDLNPTAIPIPATRYTANQFIVCSMYNP
jgi:hypothetical protein